MEKGCPVEPLEGQGPNEQSYGTTGTSPATYSTLSCRSWHDLRAYVLPQAYLRWRCPKKRKAVVLQHKRLHRMIVAQLF